MVRDISNLVQVSYTRQKEPLGLGHAVLGARGLGGEGPFGGGRAVCGVAGRRVDSGGESGYEAAHRCIRGYWGGRDCCRGSAQGSDAFVRDRGGRAGAAAAVWGADIAYTGSGGKAEARGCPLESGDYRAVCFARGDIRVFGADQTWGGRRDSVDRWIAAAGPGAGALGLHLRGRVV